MRLHMYMYVHTKPKNKQREVRRLQGCVTVL